MPGLIECWDMCPMFFEISCATFFLGGRIAAFVKSPLLGWNRAAVSPCKDALFFDFPKKISVAGIFRDQAVTGRQPIRPGTGISLIL